MQRILRNVSIAALAGFVAVLPLFASDYYTGLVIKIMIYSILALSLQLLVGGAGLVSLGHAAYFGIAAYATTLLSPESSAGNLLFVLPSAIACALMYALVTGALSLRTRGVYFIMVTLAFSQMAYYIFHDTDIGGGSDGIYLYFRPELRLGDSVLLNFDGPYAFYLLTLACLALTWAFLAMIMRSRFGAAINGIRINEARMRSAGYPTFKYKLTTYVLGGSLAGVAGFLYAAKDGFVNPQLLAWEQSGIVLLMVILGGSSRPGGAIAGAAVLTLLQEAFQSQALFGAAANHWHLTFGLSIIGLVALLPNGLAGLPAQWRSRGEGAHPVTVEN